LTFVGGRTCTDPWKMMMILTDGTVIPAHGRCYHVPGRVTETPFLRSGRSDFPDSATLGVRLYLPRARCCGVGKGLARGGGRDGSIPRGAAPLRQKVGSRVLPRRSQPFVCRRACRHHLPYLKSPKKASDTDDSHRQKR
jgi:hypothetical protein